MEPMQHRTTERSRCGSELNWKLAHFLAPSKSRVSLLLGEIAYRQPRLRSTLCGIATLLYSRQSDNQIGHD